MKKDLVRKLCAMALALGIAGLGVYGCDDDDDDNVAASGPGAFQANYATSSDFFTNMSQPITGASPHGTVRIWYSSNAQGLVGNPGITMPEGTVAIKEFDNDNDGAQDGKVVMIKQAAGFDDANNNWLYEQRQVDGTLIDSGPLSMCIGCHSGAASTDYLAGTGYAN